MRRALTYFLRPSETVGCGDQEDGNIPTGDETPVLSLRLYEAVVGAESAVMRARGGSVDNLSWET